jgi:hypothetical protein
MATLPVIEFVGRSIGGILPQASDALLGQAEMMPTITRPRTSTPLSLSARRRRSRDILIAIALEAGCSQTLIAEGLGMHQTAISKIADCLMRAGYETSCQES